MFNNLLELLNRFGWYRMFGDSGAKFVPSRHHYRGRPKKQNFKGKAKWDLVESIGNGEGLFRCRQNGEEAVKKITNLNSMSPCAQRWFNEN